MWPSSFSNHRIEKLQLVRGKKCGLLSHMPLRLKTFAIVEFSVYMHGEMEFYPKYSIYTQTTQCTQRHGYKISHGQSSYWTAKSSFLFLATDHTEADPNYTLGVDFWTMIFYNLKNSG